MRRSTGTTLGLWFVVIELAKQISATHKYPTTQNILRLLFLKWASPTFEQPQPLLVTSHALNRLWGVVHKAKWCKISSILFFTAEIGLKIQLANQKTQRQTVGNAITIMKPQGCCRQPTAEKIDFPFHSRRYLNGIDDCVH